MSKVVAEHKTYEEAKAGINFRSKLIMLVRKILTGLSGKLRQRKSRIFLRLSFLAMRKVCVYSVCMADVQNPLTVPAILVSGQAQCRCRRQNTGRTDRTLCIGVTNWSDSRCSYQATFLLVFLRSVTTIIFLFIKKTRCKPIIFSCTLSKHHNSSQLTFLFQQVSSGFAFTFYR